jgi:hypothetical protein
MSRAKDLFLIFIYLFQIIYISTLRYLIPARSAEVLQKREHAMIKRNIKTKPKLT